LTASPALRHVDRYVLELELDSGGFGVVWRARHTVTGRAVALKLLHPSRETSIDLVERFLREARILASIRSPHVVQVLDAGMTEDRQIFLAMELLEGENLARRLRRTGPLPVRDAIGLTRQILAGLGAAHAMGVVHRDLKPGNVFLAREEGLGGVPREVAKVLDFGISKSSTASGEELLTITGTILGTPHYMAPEQLQATRDVDARADLFAAVVCLYEMLSGALPWEARALDELLIERFDRQPRPLASLLPQLHPELLAIVDRGLARDPDARCRSAEELDRALAAVPLDTGPISATAAHPRVLASAAGAPPSDAAKPSTRPPMLSRRIEMPIAAVTSDPSAASSHASTSHRPPAHAPSAHPPSAHAPSAHPLPPAHPSSLSHPHPSVRPPLDAAPGTHAADAPTSRDEGPRRIAIAIAVAALLVVILAAALGGVATVWITSRPGSSAPPPIPAPPPIAPSPTAVAPSPSDPPPSVMTPATPNGAPSPARPEPTAPPPTAIADPPAAPHDRRGDRPPTSPREASRRTSAREGAREPIRPPDDGRVHITIVRVSQGLDPAAIHGYLRRIIPHLDRCQSGRQQMMRLDFTVDASGEVRDVRYVGGDRAEFMCVADQLRSASPVDRPGARGTATISLVIPSG
jgi:serine/threonine protein kinase